MVFRPEELDWPTKELREAVIDLDKGNRTVDIEIDESKITDITEDLEAKLLLLAFMPDIKLVGPDLWFERWKTKNWGGVFVRALKKKNKDQVCLQYVFTYTRQYTVVSAIWMVLVPAILALLDWFVLDFPGTLIAQLPLLLFAIVLHVADSNARFRVRSTTALIVFWLLQWIGMIPVFYWLPVFILGSWAFIFGAVWIYSIAPLRREMPGTHMMDYIPVYVWLKPLLKYPGSRTWDIERACWDVLHYKVAWLDREQLSECVWKFIPRQLRGVSPLGDGSALGEYLPGLSVARLKMQIDNPWHSMSRSSHHEGYILTLGGGFARQVRASVREKRGTLVRIIIVCGFFLIVWNLFGFQDQSALLIFIVFWLFIELSRYRFDLFKDQTSILAKTFHLYDLSRFAKAFSSLEKELEKLEHASYRGSGKEVVGQEDTVLSRSDLPPYGKPGWGGLDLGLLSGLLDLPRKLQLRDTLNQRLTKLESELEDQTRTSQDDETKARLKPGIMYVSMMLTLLGWTETNYGEWIDLTDPEGELDQLWKELQLTWMDKKHLKILWNLGSYSEPDKELIQGRNNDESKAQLLVRNKLQNPFTGEFITFLDDDRYYDTPVWKFREWLATKFRNMGMRALSKAIEMQIKAIESNPNNPQRWVRLGIMFEESKRYEESIKAYSVAARLDSKNVTILVRIALVFERLQRFEESEEAYRQAIALDPSDVDVWIKYGGLLGGQGLIHEDRDESNTAMRKFSEAEDAFRQVILLDPENIIAWQTLTVVLEKQGKEEAKEAEAKARSLRE
jgi:tetratricopeptide (TPR) repeat protein